MKKSLILYILALVMVCSLALALTINPTTFAQKPIVPSIDLPLDATITNGTGAQASIIDVNGNFDGTISSTYDQTTGVTSFGTGKLTGDNGSGTWHVLKVTFSTTGVFYYTSNMTTYTAASFGSPNVGTSGTYHYKLVSGSPSTDPTTDEIQAGVPVTEALGDQEHQINIKESDLSDGTATLYFAFQSTTTKGGFLGSSKQSKIVFGNMSFKYVAPSVIVNFSTVAGIGAISASVNGSAVSSGVSVEGGEIITLTATPGNGEFYCWKYADGTFISANPTINITVDGPKSIVAHIREKGYYQARVGNEFYTSLKDVLDNDGITGTVIVLPIDGGVTLEQSVTVRSGVTLLVPFSDDHAHCQVGGNVNKRATWAEDPNTFRYAQLNIASGASLTVNGALVVGGNYGIDTSGAYAMGLISGYYGEIVNNGTITVNGTCDVYGLITGDGAYIANSGSMTRVTFVFIDYIGGSNTAHYFNSGVFPFSLYSFQNIWCTQTVYAGAEVKARAAIYADDRMNQEEKYIIAPSTIEESLLILKSGYITIDYDETNCLSTTGNSIYEYFNLQDYGKITLCFFGDVEVGYFILNVYFKTNWEVDSAEYTFVVPYFYDINVENGGTLTIPQKLEFAFLPGSNLRVKEGGTLNVDANGTLLVVDGLAAAPKYIVRYPTATELKRDGFDAGANLIVDGTMNINGTFGGIIQTTGNTGTIVVGSDAILSAIYQHGTDRELKGVGSFVGGLIGNYLGDGIDNTAKINLVARVGRNSILNANGTVSNADSFANLQKGKTYHAFTNVTGSNTKIQTMLTTATMASAKGFSGDDCSTVNSDGTVIVRVQNMIQGTFYEKDANGNYLVPLNINIGESVSGVNVNIGLVGTLTTDANGYLLQGGSTSVVVPMDASGVFTYHTIIGENRVGPQDDEVAQFDGRGNITLTKVIKGAQLNPQTTLISIFDKDGHATAQQLQGRLVYYGTDNFGDYQVLNGAINTLAATDVSGTFNHTLYGVNLSATVFQFTQAMAIYEHNVAQLTSSTPSNLVQNAIALATEWDTLISGKTDAESQFINAQLSHLNDYFGIYKSFQLQEDVVYGQTSAVVSAIPVKGEKVTNVTVSLGDFVYDNINGLTGTLSYVGSYTHNGTNYNYNVATSGVDVNAKPITVVVSNVTGHVYGDANDQPFVYALADGYTLVNAQLDTLDQIVSLSRQSGTNAGNYNITATQAGQRTGFYAVTFQYTQDGYSVYSILPKALQITVDGQLSVEYGAQLPVSFDTVESVPSDAQLIITLDENIKNVGTYNFTISSNSNYSITTQSKFTVTPRTLFVSVVDKSTVFGDQITLEVDLQNVLDSDKEAIAQTAVFTLGNDNISGLTFTVGSYSISVTVEAGDNYNVRYANEGTLTVSKRQIRVNIDNKTSVFGNELVELTAQLDGGMLVEGDTLLGNNAIISLQKASGTNVGDYAITGSTLNDNYEVVFKNGKYTITARPIVVQIDANQTKIYDGNTIDLTAISYTIYDGENVLDTLPEGTITFQVANASANVGNYTVAGSVSGATNYTYTVQSEIYSITQKDVTVVVGNGTKVYDGKGISTWDEAVTISIADAVQADLSELVSLVKSKFVAIAQSDVSAGYDIEFSDTTHQNYNITYQTGKYAITPRAITVTIDSKTSIYGDDLVQLTATVTNGTLVVGHNLLGEQGIVTLTKANGLTVQEGGCVISGTNNNTNYDVTFETGTYTITPRPLTVHISQELTKVYDALEPNTSTFTYTVTDNANTSTFATLPEGTLVYTVVNSNVNVGTYTITGEVTNSTNYTYTVQNGKYTITQKAITFAIGNGTKVYDGQTPALDDAIQVTINGAVNADDQSQLILSVRDAFVAIAGTNVGNYPIASTFTGNNNYTVTSYTQGEFAITKRPIDITIAPIANVTEAEELHINVSATMSWQNKALDFDKAVFAIMENDQIVAYIDNGLVDAVVPFGSYTVVLYSYDDGNFDIVDFGSQTLVIDVSDDSYVVQITFNATSGKQYDGNVVAPTIVVTERISQELVPTFTYTVTRNTAVLDNKIIQDVGTYVISVAVNGHVYGTASFAIEKRQITLEIGNTGNRVYNGQPISLDELSKANFVWSGLVGNEDLSNFVTLAINSNGKDTGNYTVTGTFAHNNYQATTITPGTFSITKKDVTVVVGNGTKVYDGKGISTWDETVTISIADAVQADVSELVSLVKSKFVAIAQSDVSTGYDIAFSNTTHQNYNITYQTGKYAIEKREISVTLAATSTIYGEPIKTPQQLYALATVSGAIAADIDNLFEIATTATQGANAGTYNLILQNLNNNYKLTNAVDGTGLYTVEKRDIAITIGNASKVYDAKTPTLDQSISITIDGALASDVDSLKALVVDGFVAITQTNVNELGYTIASAFDGNANYNAPTYINGKYIIQKRGLIVTLANVSSIYGDQILSSAQMYALANIQGSVDGDKQLFQLSTNATTTSNVGQYNLQIVDGSLDANYFVQNQVDGTNLYNVQKRSITVTVNNVVGHIYGETFDANTLGAAITTGNAVNGDQLIGGIVALQTGVDSTTSVGNYPITGQVINNNYDVTFVQGNLQVVARPVTVVIGNQTSIYGQTKVAPTATLATSDVYGFVNGDNLYDYVTLANPVETDIGTYDITGCDKSTTDNYQVTVTSGKYTITARQIYVEIGRISKIYDGKANDLSHVEISIWYQEDGQVVDLTAQLKDNIALAPVTNINVGTHTIQASFVNNNNYVVAQNGWTNGALTINPRPITVTVENATSIYGDATVALTSNVTSALGLVDGDTNIYTLSCPVTSTTVVGNYPITGIKGTNTNYDVTFVNGTYTVTKRAIEIKVEDATSEYDSAFVTPKLTFVNGTSLVGNDTLAQVVKPIWSQTNKVGNYQISAQLVDENNYTLQFVQCGTYTVTPIALTVSINPVTVHYGDETLTNAQLLAYATVSGKIAQSDVDKQLFALQARATNTDIVGNYDVVGTALDDNYSITFVNMQGKYQIAKRPVTLLVKDATSIYSNADATLVAVVTQGNFAFGEQPSDFVTLARTAGANVGNYNITATKVQNALTSNYDVTVEYTTGNYSLYTITPRAVTFDISSFTIYNTDSWQKITSLFSGAVREDIGSDQLEVSYKVLMRTITNGAQTQQVFLTEDNLSREIALGNFEILATNANANYDVTFVNGTLTVVLPRVSVGQITQNYTYNPEGIQLFNWQTQIVNYIPEITSANAFNAKLMDADGNVVLSGSVVDGVVDTGNYTLVIELVHTGQYAWSDGVVTTYQVTVDKLDISNTIVEFGFTNGQWLTNSASGVYAMVQDNFDIYVDTTLWLDGQVVYDLTQCGNYTLVAVIDDANYCGQKTFNFVVIDDIAPTMSTLNTMLNDYNMDDDYATQLESLTQMVQLVATLNTADAQLQIENNVIYQQLVQSVTTRWSEFVEVSNQDMEVATSVWQNVVVQVVATISLLTAAAFVVSKRLGL